MSASKIVECTNFASKIAKKVYNELKEQIDKCDVDLYTISQFGNSRILEETSSVYKKCKNKGIAFPVSISLNNCVGNYTATSEGTLIKSGDIVKIELGVAIDGYIGMIGETFVAGQPEHLKKELLFLDQLSEDVAFNLRAGETNDTLRIFIETECTDNGIYPIENCISYQQCENHMKTYDSKYMILNYRKYWDQDDNLVSEDNLCFDFEENEVYTINITCAVNNPTNPEYTKDLKYKEPLEPQLYRINEINYQLKLNSSRMFLNEAKSKHRNYVFDATEMKKNIKMKMGMKECLENGILESLPILYANSPVQIIHKKFTLVVKKQI
jgi:methionine aminopeptidase